MCWSWRSTICNESQNFIDKIDKWKSDFVDVRPRLIESSLPQPASRGGSWSAAETAAGQDPTPGSFLSRTHILQDNNTFIIMSGVKYWEFMIPAKTSSLSARLTWRHEERDPEPAGENSISQTLQVGAVERKGATDQNIEDNTKALKE